MTSMYSSDLETQVDEGQKKWTTGPDITNKVDTNDYIKFKLVVYEYFDAKGFDLWELVRKDFGGFDEETFEKPQSNNCGTTVASSLYNLIDANEPTAWKPQDLVSYFNSYGSFNSSNLMLRSFVVDICPGNDDKQNIDEKCKLDNLPLTPHGVPERGTNLALVKNYGRELANLAKMYSEESKYCGENENFEFKLTRFCDLCNRAAIPKDQDGDKSTLECLQLLINNLRHLQHGLGQNLRTDEFLHNKLVTVCQEHIACRYVYYKPAETVAGLINDLRSSITTGETIQPGVSQLKDAERHGDFSQSTQAYSTDRRYQRQNHRTIDNSASSQSRPSRAQNFNRNHFGGMKKFFMYGKQGCWSKNYASEDCNNLRKKFENRLDQYITEYEGEENRIVDEAMEALIIDHDSESLEDDSHTKLNPELFMTSDQFQVIRHRNGQHSLVIFRSFTQLSPRNPTASPLMHVLLSAIPLHKSIHLLDTLPNNPMLDLDLTQAGAVNVQFGIGSTTSIGAINVKMPIGTVCFHVIKAKTPFLLCLKDVDTLKAYYNNVTDQPVTSSITLPIKRRYGHSFLLWEEFLTCFISHSLDQNPCYPTMAELRRLHRRFGHPSA
ncbi:hypothetical protein GcM1_186004, partial [Golovinomyces cichoracearum]